MKILFLDIESVPQYDCLQLENILFMKKFKKQIEEVSGQSLETTPYPQIIANKIYMDNAALYAEFGKVCCVSVGLLTATKFQVKALASRNEKDILIKLTEAIEKSQCTHIAAHNGKEFDFSFLKRRYIINGLPVPAILETEGRKTWDLPFIDTMDMWSGVQWKYKVSLELLAYCLGIPSPKTEMDGSKVAEVFYGSYKVSSGELPFDAEDEAMKVIGKYCNGDVVTLYKVYCRLKGIEAVSDENIVMA